MHHILEPPKADRASQRFVSRRALLEGGAGVLAAVGSSAGATLLARPANAADPAPGDQSARRLASLRIREAAARAYLDDAEPSHRSNGDELRYPDKRASFAKTLPHNDAGEVDADAFARFVSVLSSGDAGGFETIPRDRAAEVGGPQCPH